MELIQTKLPRYGDWCVPYVIMCIVLLLTELISHVLCVLTFVYYNYVLLAMTTPPPHTSLVPPFHA